MSSCVCAECKKPWGASGSPARCPNCGEVSSSIAILKESAKMGAIRKKRWQDPEYQAKMRAGMKKRWQDPEYQAKMRAAQKKRWQEHRAKQNAILV